MAEVFELFNRGVTASLNAQENQAAGDYQEALVCHEEAVAAFDQVLAIEPDHVGALGGKGMSLAQLGQTEEAAETFQRAIDCEPDHAESYRQFGLCQIELGDMAKAWEATEKAVKLNKDKDFRAHASAEIAAFGSNILATIQAHRDPDNPEQEIMYYQWAASTFALACRANPQNAEAKQHLKEINAKLPKLGPDL